MSQDIILRSGEASPNDIQLHAVPVSPASDVTIFLYALESTPQDIKLSDPTVVASGGGGTIEGSLSVSGVATVSLSATKIINGSISVSGVASNSVAPTLIKQGAVSVSGVCTVSLTPALLVSGQIGVSGQASATVTATKVLFASIGVSGVATTQVAGAVQNNASLAVSGVASVAVSGSSIKHASVAVSGVATVQATAYQVVNGSIGVSGVATVSVESSVTGSQPAQEKQRQVRGGAWGVSRKKRTVVLNASVFATLNPLKASVSAINIKPKSFDELAVIVELENKIARPVPVVKRTKKSGLLARVGNMSASAVPTVIYDNTAEVLCGIDWAE